MYWNVPMIVPCSVRSWGVSSVGSEESCEICESTPSALCLASPKSKSFTPDFVSMTFPGFKSR
jgi:hypothetical protein